MNIIQTIFAFIISLGILVSIHEWGHFWVARKMGVKILHNTAQGKASFFCDREEGLIKVMEAGQSVVPTSI